MHADGGILSNMNANKRRLTFSVPWPRANNSPPSRAIGHCEFQDHLTRCRSFPGYNFGIRFR